MKPTATRRVKKAINPLLSPPGGLISNTFVGGGFLNFSKDNSIILISSFLEIDFEINISDKKSRRFDLSEVIFKCVKVL